MFLEQIKYFNISGKQKADGGVTIRETMEET